MEKRYEDGWQLISSYGVRKFLEHEEVGEGEGRLANKRGLHGTHPSLTDLSEGDIKHTVDFRSVYGTVLGDWLKAPDMESILGAEYPKLGLIG